MEFRDLISRAKEVSKDFDRYEDFRDAFRDEREQIIAEILGFGLDARGLAKNGYEIAKEFYVITRKWYGLLTEEEKAEKERLEAEQKELAKQEEIAKQKEIEKLKRIEEAERQRMINDAIDWLVDNGVNRVLLEGLVESGQFDIATIEEAKRSADKFKGININVGAEALLKRALTLQEDEIAKEIRAFVRFNIDEYTEEDLLNAVKKAFDKVFRISYTKGYIKRNGSYIAPYFRVLI